MQYRDNKQFIRNLARQGDLINTIQGGVIMPSVNIQNYDTGIEIKVKAPTINPDRFSLYLNYNQLTVYILQNNASNEEAQQVPVFSRAFQLPFFVDMQNIDAVYENGELRVMLPYIQHPERYQGKIDIHK